MAERVTPERHSEEVCFGKCMNCGTLRWVSSEALKRKMGWKCRRCGGRGIRQPGRLRLFERFYLVYWIFWEHIQINPGSVWYLNPLNDWKIIKMGMRPKLYMGDSEAETPATDEREELDGRAEGEIDRGDKPETAHSHS